MRQICRICAPCGGTVTDRPAAMNCVPAVPDSSRAPSALSAAIGFCQGAPMRNKIEAHGPDRLAEASEVAAAALTRQFGPGPITGKIQAHVITAVRKA